MQYKIEIFSGEFHERTEVLELMEMPACFVDYVEQAMGISKEDVEKNPDHYPIFAYIYMKMPLILETTYVGVLSWEHEKGRIKFPERTDAPE